MDMQDWSRKMFTAVSLQTKLFVEDGTYRTKEISGITTGAYESQIHYPLSLSLYLPDVLRNTDQK